MPEAQAGELVQLPAKLAFAEEEVPLLRGFSHLIAFFVSLALGVLVLSAASGVLPRLGTAVFAASVTAMFGASALYHRGNWTPDVRASMRRLDHGGVYFCIAGSYSAYAILALSGGRQIAILAAVWVGSVAGISMKVAWADAPRWLPLAIGLALGGLGLWTVPQVIAAMGPAPVALTLAGGLLYALGGTVYAIRRPDPFPRVFGFHEVFHLFVIAAVACHYVAIALFAFL